MFEVAFKNGDVAVAAMAAHPSHPPTELNIKNVEIDFTPAASPLASGLLGGIFKSH